MTTEVMVCAVLGIMTVAPMRRPKDCATSCVSITVAQLQKKAPADRLPHRTGHLFRERVCKTLVENMFQIS